MISDLCTDLFNEFSEIKETYVNCYLTPPNEQGFSDHYDDHDVFILQLKGCKKWQIFDRYISDPTSEIPYNYDDTKKGNILLELNVEQGDILYIPRGFLHSAKTIDVSSLHLTVTVIPIIWADLLNEAMKRMVVDHSLLRKKIEVSELLNKSELNIILNYIKNIDYTNLLSILRQKNSKFIDYKNGLVGIENKNLILYDTILNNRLSSHLKLESQFESIFLISKNQKLSLPKNLKKP